MSKVDNTANSGASADSMATEYLRATMKVNGSLFDSTETLAHIAAFADSRSAERYSVLSGVLMRAVAAVPPTVVLPPIIGGAVSLNLLTASVGASGGGKGTADKCAAEAVRFKVGGRRNVPPLPLLPIGTGEGINRTYATARKQSGRAVITWHTDTALFGCRDIASLAALTARQGATLVPELLKAFMGEELGFANADAERRVILPMHSYRLCLSAGVQPANGGVLIDDQAQRDGVPQRFIWTPVRPGIARTRRAADAAPVDPLTVSVPDFGTDPFALPDDDGEAFDPAARPLVPLDVAESIRQTIIDADAEKDLDPFGRCGDPLAGHRLLTQLNVAAALAILHNRTDVDAEHWEIAERLIEVSSKVADAVAVASGTAAEDDAMRQGHLDGTRQAAADDSRHETGVRALADQLDRFLTGRGWTAHSDLRRSVSPSRRRFFDDTVTLLLDSKRIDMREHQNDKGQKGIQYMAMKSGARPYVG